MNLQQKEPVFHKDWFSKNIPHLEKFLSHLKGKRCAEGLEIGSWEGKSASWFLQNILTGEGSKLTCVDNFKGNPENELLGYEKDVAEIFESNMKALGLWERVKLLNEYSENALKLLHPMSFDFIYVDGSHNPKDVLIDLCLSWILLKRGGIMIMDDYLLCDPDTGSEPKPAIDAFFHVFKRELIELHYDWQVVWRKV